jgi:penicillin-binding protein 1A
VTNVLHQNVLAGTGKTANFGCPAAGKTGTTEQFNDAWFVGYTPHLATATWVGYPNALVSMTSVHGIAVAGATFPSQIWHDYMTVAHGNSCDDFPPATTPVQWAPFFGHYATTGATGSTGPAGPQNKKPKSNGGATPNKGYDPRLYTSPPQKSPKDHSKPNKGGNGGGGGNGAGTGSPADPTGH